MLLQGETNKALLSLLSSHCASTSFAWPDDVTELNISDTILLGLFPDGHIPPEISQDLLFIDSVYRKFEVRVLRIPHHSLSKKFLQSIKGAELPKDFAFDPNSLLSNPGDGTIGLCILDTPISDSTSSPDFLFMCPSFLRNEDIVEMGIDEDKSIKEMVKGARMGAASGFLLLPHNTTCFDPQSLSVGTHNQRELFRGVNHKSTALSVDYTAPATGKRIRWASAYRDMNMSRFSHDSKKRMALVSPCYRRLLIKEMSSRLRCLSVTSLFHLNPLGGPNIWQQLIAAIVGRNSASSHQWQTADASVSCWEAILLEWACKTGEMRNHEACRTHQDGNKSHFMETMWLGGKSDSKAATSSTAQVKAMTNGKLVLPIQGVVFDIRCGRDFLHMGLKVTMHVPDETRDHLNWSRVHGP
jgi:hypothetical protein